MDIKTVVLAIPFSSVLRHITNKVLAEVTARWPVLQKILSRTCSKENSMLKISFSETPTEERWILHGRLTVPWVHELWTCSEEKPPRGCGMRLHRGLQRSHIHRQERGATLAHPGQSSRAIHRRRDLYQVCS
jgi:hypothetical protein